MLSTGHTHSHAPSQFLPDRTGGQSWTPESILGSVQTHASRAGVSASPVGTFSCSETQQAKISCWSKLLPLLPPFLADCKYLVSLVAQVYRGRSSSWDGKAH